jgi:hypothetical protein
MSGFPTHQTSGGGRGEGMEQENDAMRDRPKHLTCLAGGAGAEATSYTVKLKKGDACLDSPIPVR